MSASCRSYFGLESTFSIADGAFEVLTFKCVRKKLHRRCFIELKLHSGFFVLLPSCDKFI